MIKTIVGLVLLISPLLLLVNFKDKKSGFFYIILCFFAFHMAVGVITQAFSIFNYWTVFTMNFILLFIIIKNIKFDESMASFKRFFRGIDWILFFIILIAFFYLYSAHFNYSGGYSVLSTPDYQQAEKISYDYPYFSDEWYSISLVKYSIETGKLPFRNSLIEGNPIFPNFNFQFNSFISEITILLDIDPLTGYVFFSIVSGVTILVLVYLFLRLNNLSKISSSAASLSILLITSGANLPGIWTLIPLITGIVIFIIGLSFISPFNKQWVLFSSLMLFFFYAPLLLLYVLTIMVKRGMGKHRENIHHVLLIFLGVIIMTVLFYFIAVSNTSFLAHIKNAFSLYFSKIFFTSYTGNFIPKFSILNIVPLHSILFFIMGIPFLIKRRFWLAGLCFFGFLYWLLYSFVDFRILIDYERVVVFTSVLVVMLSGFGVERFILFMKKNSLLKGEKILKYILVGIFVLFFVLSFSYTQRNFNKAVTLTAVDKSTGNEVFPAAPANTYLLKEDLDIFSGINNSNFLSHPWKGTTIGVATNNYPLSTKPGTITINPHLYNEFLISDCGVKMELAENLGIDYIYIPFNLNCAGFTEIEKSSEGFVLYKFENQPN